MVLKAEIHIQAPVTVQLQREGRQDTRDDKNIKRELGRERDWGVSSYEDELKSTQRQK